MSDRRPCLSYWLPPLKAAGLPVPKTAVVTAGPDWHDALGVFDSPERFPEIFAAGEVVVKRIADAVARAADAVGPFPVFLRTGRFSGKHNWRNTCFVRYPGEVVGHVYALIEMSEMFGMLGELPWDVWAVREMLPTTPLGVCERYGGMPVCREFRYFVSGGAVACRHPYWPAQALEDGGVAGAAAEGWYERMCRPDGDADRLAGRAADAFAGDGDWSVDVLATTRGWYVTDMAPAESSWHWPGCPVAAGRGWGKGQ